MCIFVVEDNVLIRNILVEELRDAGYDVRESETGDAAVGLLAAITPPLSLLITDIHMPGATDGIALAAHVRARHPHVPIIYTTGRPDALRRAGPLEDRQFLVRKPYLPSEILEHARALLPHGTPR
jgi:CheY-like chemotaxis protein